MSEVPLQHEISFPRQRGGGVFFFVDSLPLAPVKGLCSRSRDSPTIIFDTRKLFSVTFFWKKMKVLPENKCTVQRKFESKVASVC